MTSARDGSDEITLVKLGGSLITDKRGVAEARHDVIERLAREIADADLGGRLIVGHGSGSFGHVAAKEHGVRARGSAKDGGATPDPPTPVGAAAVQDQAARLHRLVVTALVEAGAAPFSLPPSAWMTANAGRPRKAFLDPLLVALDKGFVPVLCGDVVVDDAWRASVLSTETVLHDLIVRLRRRGETRVRRQYWLGETAGVWDREGEPLAEITTKTFSNALRAVRPAAGTDVTGGMELRLRTARELARMGVESWIVDGREPGLLAAALAGEDVPGTVFRAQDVLRGQDVPRSQDDSPA